MSEVKLVTPVPVATLGSLSQEGQVFGGSGTTFGQSSSLFGSSPVQRVDSGSLFGTSLGQQYQQPSSISQVRPLSPRSSSPVFGTVDQLPPFGASTIRPITLGGGSISPRVPLSSPVSPIRPITPSVSPIRPITPSVRSSTLGSSANVSPLRRVNTPRSAVRPITPIGSQGQTFRSQVVMPSNSPVVTSAVPSMVAGASLNPHTEAVAYIDPTVDMGHKHEVAIRDINGNLIDISKHLVDNELIDMGFAILTKVLINVNGTTACAYIEAMSPVGDVAYVHTDCDAIVSLDGDVITLNQVSTDQAELIPIETAIKASECMNMEICAVAYKCDFDSDGRAVNGICVQSKDPRVTNRDDGKTTAEARYSQFVDVDITGSNLNGMKLAEAPVAYPVIKFDDIKNNPLDAIIAIARASHALRKENIALARAEFSAFNGKLMELAKQAAAFEITQDKRITALTKKAKEGSLLLLEYEVSKSSGAAKSSIATVQQAVKEQVDVVRALEAQILYTREFYLHMPMIDALAKRLADLSAESTEALAMM